MTSRIEVPRGDSRGIRRRDYTDYALVIGPNQRWAEEDYADLVQARPEVLLGYRVQVVGVDLAMYGVFHALPSKIILLSGWDENLVLSQRSNMINELERLQNIHGTKVEGWHVHRTMGIWKWDLW